MLAENYTHMRSNQIVTEIVKQGLFGIPYYAEGEYLHELKLGQGPTKWRRIWHTGINGITYGTHSLGPILQWMNGDRVVRVCCAGSGHHYKDPTGQEFENEDSCVMLCKMKSGGLVKIRVDMISDRPGAHTNYQLQGTDGCYESARAPGEKDRLWLRSLNNWPPRPPGSSGYRSHWESANRVWTDLEELAEEFMPDSWRSYGKLSTESGHGGSDFIQLIDFVDTIREGVEPIIGIHEVMDMTLPGLISQESIESDNQWIQVPNSRDW